MGNPNFEQVSVSKELGTKAKIAKLARLLTVRAEGEQVTKAEAVDIAVTNELKRRKAK